MVLLQLTKKDDGDKITKPGAGILVKLSRAGEYEKANLCITEDCKFFGFLDQSLSPL